MKKNILLLILIIIVICILCVKNRDGISHTNSQNENSVTAFESSNEFEKDTTPYDNSIENASEQLLENDDDSVEFIEIVEPERISNVLDKPIETSEAEIQD